MDSESNVVNIAARSSRRAPAQQPDLDKPRTGGQRRRRSATRPGPARASAPTDAVVFEFKVAGGGLPEADDTQAGPTPGAAA